MKQKILWKSSQNQEIPKTEVKGQGEGVQVSNPFSGQCLGTPSVQQEQGSRPGRLLPAGLLTGNEPC